MIWVVIAVSAVAIAWFLIYLAELHEPSNWERDEVPPPERTVTPSDWRRGT